MVSMDHFSDLGLDILWKIAVLKSNRQVVVVDRFIDRVSAAVKTSGRRIVCQALERFTGELELAFWDDLTSLFEKSLTVLEIFLADSVSCVFGTSFLLEESS